MYPLLTLDRQVIAIYSKATYPGNPSSIFYLELELLITIGPIIAVKDIAPIA